MLVYKINRGNTQVVKVHYGERGPRGLTGLQGVQGIPGKDAVGFFIMHVDADGNLYMTHNESDVMANLKYDPETGNLYVEH